MHRLPRAGVFNGSADALVEELGALGWQAQREPNSLMLRFERDHDGERFEGTAWTQGPDAAGNVTVNSIRGERRVEVGEERAQLGPVVEPLETRSAVAAAYTPGSRHCGAV